MEERLRPVMELYSDRGPKELPEPAASGVDSGAPDLMGPWRGVRAGRSAEKVPHSGDKGVDLYHVQMLSGQAGYALGQYTGYDYGTTAALYKTPDGWATESRAFPSPA